MTKPRRPKSEICLTTRERQEAIDGIDICRKSKGHTDSDDPQKREHYDPSSETRWAGGRS